MGGSNLIASVTCGGKGTAGNFLLEAGMTEGFNPYKLDIGGYMRQLQDKYPVYKEAVASTQNVGKHPPGEPSKTAINLEMFAVGMFSRKPNEPTIFVGEALRKKSDLYYFYEYANLGAFPPVSLLHLDCSKKIALPRAEQRFEEDKVKGPEFIRKDFLDEKTGNFSIEKFNTKYLNDKRAAAMVARYAEKLGIPVTYIVNEGSLSSFQEQLQAHFEKYSFAFV